MKRFWLLLLVMFGLWPMIDVQADDVDYSIPSYKGELTLFSDNTAEFLQQVTFDYDSEFRGQYVTLGLAGELPEGAAILGVPEVLAYKNQTEIPVTVEEESWTDGRKLKIYNGGQDGDKIELIIRWRLQNLLAVHPDIARLNWAPISNWDVPLQQVEVTVRTEKPSQNSQLAVHRGYFRPASDIHQVAQSYKFTASNVSGQLHIHAYWDKAIVDGEAKFPQAGLPLYQDVERQLAEGQKNLSFRLEVLFVGLSCAGLVLGLLALVRFRRMVDGQRRLPRRVYELPDDLPPLVVAQAIFNQSLRDTAPDKSQTGQLAFDNMLQASLLDLIDRKYVTVSGTGDTAVLAIAKEDGLAAFELALLNMAFGEKRSCPVTDLFGAYAYDEEKEEALKERYNGSQLERRVQDLAQKHLTHYRGGLRQVSSHVLDLVEQLGLPTNYRPLNAKENMMFRIGIGLIVASLGLSAYSIIAVLVHAFRPVVLSYVTIGALGVLLLVWGVRMHWPYAERGVVTAEGRLRVEPWQGFWQMLKDIKSFDRVELEGLVVWNRLLVYATLFGEAKRVEQYLRLHQIELPEDTGLTLSYGHYSFLHHSLHQNMVTSSQLATTASHFTVSSGSSGISGGFSGGGGGGGGGSF